MQRFVTLWKMFIGIFLLVAFLKLNGSCNAVATGNVSVVRSTRCMHKTFCENVTHYPTDMVQEAVKKHPHLRDYASIQTDGQVDVDEVAPEEESLCIATEQIVYPKYGVTKNSEWKYIINHEEVQQSVHVEICREEGKPCRVIEGFAEGYYTKCKQKYIYRQLLSLTENGSITLEFFQFPASCCCHVEFRAYKLLSQFDDRL
ncbi:protein spaetzle [Ceratina calcarata]|uniref:Protein spaetzle n=1 Tax=Ceratina calcarata TaxID=156304 RepID=A0AAJ7N6K5_9HYME|nr:protein spaetzle [Ceratina calcarata]